MLSTRRALLAATALLPVAVAACANNNPAAGVVASYTIATSAAADYEASLAPADPKRASIKACEGTAWVVMKPVSDALIAGTAPSAAALNAAQSAIAPLSNCLGTVGVKIGA